ncbi:MAG: hypothetical protein ACRD1S_17545, partial [Vicinamibacterales bacterium]
MRTSSSSRVLQICLVVAAAPVEGLSAFGRNLQTFGGSMTTGSGSRNENVLEEAGEVDLAVLRRCLDLGTMRHASKLGGSRICPAPVSLSRGSAPSPLRTEVLGEGRGPDAGRINRLTVER